MSSHVVTFADLPDGRTQLTIDVTMICLAEMIPMSQSGWNSTFDKLAVVLAKS